MSTTQLTPTQQAILTHAIEHTEGRIDWFPENVNGGARVKVLAGLANRRLTLHQDAREEARPQSRVGEDQGDGARLPHRGRGGLTNHRAIGARALPLQKQRLSRGRSDLHCL